MQHLRNLERDGVIPVAARTSSGHRSWGELHVLSAVAYRELAAGAGPTTAKELLRGLQRPPPAVFLALLDDAHADLARERRTLRLAREAVAAIAAEPLAAPRPSDVMTISELVGALGTTSATPRHWEAEELLAPQRAGRGHIRTYSPVQVRDARVIHQLRAAGYRIPQLRPVLRTLLNPTEHQRSPGERTESAGQATHEPLPRTPTSLCRPARRAGWHAPGRRCGRTSRWRAVDRTPRHAPR